MPTLKMSAAAPRSEWSKVTGRDGVVAPFVKDSLPEGVNTPFDLVGENTVFIDDWPCKVKAVEHWAIQCPSAIGDDICHHPFGLLVQVIDNYWDGFIDQRPGLPGFMR